MKFNEFKYERPNFETTKAEIDKLLNDLSNSKTKEEFINIFEEINVIRGHINTMATLCSVRNSINTSDEFYDAENNYWDEISPMYSEINSNLYKIIINTPLKEELKDVIPETF
ncbi:MAG: M3 family oligoendopeptidase, partial [Anaerorhabdus sp.]